MFLENIIILSYIPRVCFLIEEGLFVVCKLSSQVIVEIDVNDDSLSETSHWNNPQCAKQIQSIAVTLFSTLVGGHFDF